MTQPYEPTLKGFFVAMQAWIDAGKPVEGTFVRNMGLCGNLIRFCANPHMPYAKLTNELHHLFHSTHL